MRKILITGGHLTPALAEMSELKKREWQIYYIGRKNALEGDAAISQEYRIITSLGYPFQVITAGRWHRDFNPLKSLFSLFKIQMIQKPEFASINFDQNPFVVIWETTPWICSSCRWEIISPI